MLICPTAPSEVPMEELRAHLPIGAPAILRDDGREPEPVDLGRGVVIDRLADEDAELVINACTPRGHYFAPIKQFGQRYSFVRTVDLDEWREKPFRWDPDGVIYDALSLSRLVRDNANSTAYAARIADFDDGRQTVVYTLPAESKHAYRLREDRDWLDEQEGPELSALLAAYWRVDAFPSRVSRAMWRTEYASWLKWGDLVLPMLVSGLESLLKTERFKATSQFPTRVPLLAAELGFNGVTEDYCERMYDARSEWVHGAHVRLFTTGHEHDQAQEQGTEEGPADSSQRRAFADICRLQDVLRRTVRRCIEDDRFRAVFEDDERIRSRWPI